MTKRPKVWEPRAQSKPEVLPEWVVTWWALHWSAGMRLQMDAPPTRAKIAWDAWTQVKGAPAFGSCRVVRVKGANEE